MHHLIKEPRYLEGECISFCGIHEPIQEARKNSINYDTVLLPIFTLENVCEPCRKEALASAKAYQLWFLEWRESKTKEIELLCQKLTTQALAD